MPTVPSCSHCSKARKALDHLMSSLPLRTSTSFSMYLISCFTTCQAGPVSADHSMLEREGSNCREIQSFCAEVLIFSAAKLPCFLVCHPLLRLPMTLDPNDPNHPKFETLRTKRVLANLRLVPCEILPPSPIVYSKVNIAAMANHGNPAIDPASLST